MNLNPSRQINLLGHNNLFNHLVNLYEQKKFPNKILLSGEKGIGKSTMSYHIINYVLSVNENHPYDLDNYKINSHNKNFLLIQNKSNPNFNLIDIIDEKKNIDINQIRNLILNLNKSSFNNKPRFILIDNIELLNISAINALLKIIEEPNENINFILINNNKNILSTLKSRCLNFKIFLTYEKAIKVINELLQDDVFTFLNKELINNYSTPGQLLKLISFGSEFKINLKDTNVKSLLSLIIKEKYFKKDTYIKNLTYNLIELYFRNTISVSNIELINLYNIFIKKINDTQKFNLDDESLFMEFENKVLNG